MTRASDWEKRLTAYIGEKRAAPFEWGVNDCCHFVAGAVEAMTGENPMTEFTGRYDDNLGARVLLREIGAGTLEKALDERFPPIPVGSAQRGDIAMLDGNLGIVMGNYAWFVSDDGLERCPLDLWDKCWSVGRG